MLPVRTLIMSETGTTAQDKEPCQKFDEKLNPPDV